MFPGKGVLEIRRIFTGEHPCRSAVSIKSENNFIEITLRHGCSPSNLLHIFSILFFKNTSGQLLLYLELFMTKTMKLLGSTKCKKTIDKNGERVLHLEYYLL